MRGFFFTVLLFVILGCVPEEFSPGSGNNFEDERLSNEIMKKVADKLEKEAGLKPCGSGGGMMDEIKMLALSFFYYQPVDMDEARRLLITAVDTFKDAINADERIRPYLFEYPFPPKRIEIYIVVKDPNDPEKENGYLRVFSFANGKAEYMIRGAKSGRLENIHEETYSEALQRLAENKTAENSKPRI